ncbi:hypothetical protein TB2_039282 [Malus domestica]
MDSSSSSFCSSFAAAAIGRELRGVGPPRHPNELVGRAKEEENKTDKGLDVGEDLEDERTRSIPRKKKVRGLVDQSRTGPFEMGLFKSSSSDQICNTRPDPSRFLFKQVRSGPSKFGPGPARAHL